MYCIFQLQEAALLEDTEAHGWGSPYIRRLSVSCLHNNALHPHLHHEVNLSDIATDDSLCTEPCCLTWPCIEAWRCIECNQLLVPVGFLVLQATQQASCWQESQRGTKQLRQGMTCQSWCSRCKTMYYTLASSIRNTSMATCSPSGPVLYWHSWSRPHLIW